ncbi:synaptotagmin-like protein 2 isoform X5 [Dasypus novemcinctus]|uniref:synaptotagmin-like protein 2 isoform X5 n=1 Tax=Dasypus novemcinctus TaxID=9361 RepID=UPI00265DE6D8|nr:synaptotagmin-like protein 2 isoform X7 [Dasypus novemcinctus]
MIDLSFLTDEEQEAIMKVLQRDADLKRAEEERVRHLPEKIKDDQQLKNMSGQWFYEAKAKRHRDKIHGADVIRASMRRRRPRQAEQSKSRAQESWVNNVNQDALLPAELAGVVEEPEEDAAPGSSSSSVANPASTVIGMSLENTRKPSVPQAKQRKNPFNGSQLPEDHLSLQTKNEQSKNGRAGLFQTSKEDELLESKEKSSILDISSQKLEKAKHTFPGPVNGSQIKAPIPKARKMIYKSTDSKQEDNQSFPRQRTDSLNTRGAPRGILKRNSSSSSTDSETVRFNPNFESKSKIVSPSLIIHERISEKEHSLGDDSPPNSPEPLKHVRFSAVQDELPQSSGLIRGREVGEFGVLEADRIKNGSEDAGIGGELRNDPVPSQYRKPLPFHQSASSPSASENETHQPTTSHSFPINGPHLHSEVVTARPPSLENSPTVSEHKAQSSELARLESEVPRSPADEPSQIPDLSSRDHQQGKPPLLTALKAGTSSRSGPYATEIMKTTDDSISKVLDWFNRSSHSDDKSSLKHLQEIESKEKTGSKSQVAIATVANHTRLKDNGSKALYATKLKPVASDSTCQVGRDLLPSGNYQDNDVTIKSKPVDLSQRGSQKEGSGILQPFESDRPSQGSQGVDSSLGAESRGEGTGVSSPTSGFPHFAHKGSNAEYQVPYNIKDVGNLSKEGPPFHVHRKNRGNAEVNFDSSTVVKEPSLKDDMKAERRSKGGDICILKPCLESETIESPETADCGSPVKKSEVQLQQEVTEPPKNQVQREKYKRVRERISFWEREKGAAELTHKEPTSSCSQGPPAKAHQLVKSEGVCEDSLSTSQSEHNQVTVKPVALDEDGPASLASSFYFSNKPKVTMPQISVPSEGYPSADKSGDVPMFQNKINESMKILPVADSLHSGRDITLPALKPTSTGGNEVHTPLEKDHSLISDPNPNFKVLPLRERMSETNADQVYHHSQFENLRKFWDLETHSNGKTNVERNTTTPSHKNSGLSNSQKPKEFSDLKSPEKNTHEEVLLSQNKVLGRQEMVKLNSKCVLQVPSDEAIFPWRPPRKSIHQSGNESSEINLENNMEGCLTPVFKEEKDYLDQEVQECVVKTNVLSKDYKVTFNDNLQKLLSETSSPALQPSGGKVHVKQVLEPGVSENRTWPQKTAFAGAEQEAQRPKEVVNEYVDKTVAPPKVEHDTLTANLDRLLKEATGTSPSPLQTTLEPVTTGNNSEPEESRVSEKGLEQCHDTSAHQREIKGFVPEEEETSGNRAVPQRGESGSEEEPRPVLKTLERSAARKMPFKSLEDISSDASKQAKVDHLPEELVHSAEDVSTVPSPPDNQFSHPDTLKRMSKSVPAFLQDESDGREADTASESSYQLRRHKKSPSSLTTLSSSSGMTSLSSVSSSVMSVYSGDFGNLEVKGNIQFAVDYVDSLKELHIFVAQCKDLAAADAKKQRSDPYVKTYLLPDKGKMGKKKTLVVKKTLNPVYNEILRYKIEKQILKTQKLNLSVWHRDTFKRNSFLGEVELDLETWDWDNKQNKQLKWYPLKQKTVPVAIEAENRGEMKLALQYVPEPIPGKKLSTTGEVHIWVKECLDLPLLRGSHLNSFVKCTILPDTSRKCRQKTRAVGSTANPVFNHTMVYDGFRPEDLTEACVELTVWDHYKLTNRFLGGLRIGFGTGKSYGTEVDWMDSTSEEAALWEKMVNSPNTWTEATLPLRVLLIAKISK